MKQILLLSTFILFKCFIHCTLSQLPQIIFHATLTGSDVVPASGSNATGLVSLVFNEDRSKITVTGMLVDLEGTSITNISLYKGNPSQNGVLVTNISTALNSNKKLLNGELNADPILLSQLLKDNIYVAVTTDVYPNQAIRGQFIGETDLDYQSLLTGSQVVPLVNTNAVAYGGIHFPKGSEEIIYAFVTKDLSGPITSIGIYEGEPGQNGTLVATFAGTASTIVQGVVYLDTIVGGFLDKGREGKLYIAMKTAAYPEGEIRGKIDFLGYFSSLSPANGVQQVPNPGPTAGFGMSTTVLSPQLDSLTTTVLIKSITPTMVGVYKGAPATTGTLYATLNPTGVPGLYRAKYPISAAELTDFSKGLLYINVSTSAFPNGEIRGQIKNNLRRGYTFDLCGAQVVPPVQTNAYGVGMASVDQNNCYIYFKVITEGLENITDVDIYAGATGQNGPALYGAPVSKPISVGQDEITATVAANIENGLNYFMYKTADFPNGQIRGQIKRTLTCSPISGLTSLTNEFKTVVYPNPCTDVVTLNVISTADLEGNLCVFDLFGNLMLTQPVSISNGSQTIELNSSAWPAGHYNVQFVDTQNWKTLVYKGLVKVE